jgi:catechol 2,3-dioxygenase-like lactoylglutathione lyase family enzyme
MDRGWNTPGGDVIRYAHTNLIARDWRALADFYCRHFDCTPAPPERDLADERLALATGLPGAHLRGIHLRLPGHGENGPTLEIYDYTELVEREPAAANRLGYGHLAFEVEDVAAKYAEVIAAGGSALGEIVTFVRAGLPALTMAYAQDPEGNVIEIQHWESA